MAARRIGYPPWYDRVMMDRNTYVTVSGVIFAAIAVLHAARSFYGWPAVIGTFAVPMWLSWAALVVSGYLAYAAFQLKR